MEITQYAKMLHLATTASALKDTERSLTRKLLANKLTLTFFVTATSTAQTTQNVSKVNVSVLKALKRQVLYVLTSMNVEPTQKSVEIEQIA